MLMEQRHKLILEELTRTGSVKNADLVKRMGVSSETIRKDLELLESQGLLSRVHGGALAGQAGESAERSQADYVPFDMRLLQNLDVKMQLVAKAAEFVHEGQRIALDAGTSSWALAHILKEKFHRLTVVTNSIKIVLELMDCPGFTVICTGGVLMSDEYSFVSDFAFNVLEKCNLNLTFLTASGVTVETGLTDQRMEDIRVQDKMRRAAQQTIAVVDSSKFLQPSLLSICSLRDIDILITDDNLAPDLAANIRREVGELILV
ncbi:MAG: DeoR/GlpR family DNA-binding transcription regulator [Oscillibacter sp.]